MRRETWLEPDLDEEPDFGFNEIEIKEENAGEQLNEPDWLQIATELVEAKDKAAYLREVFDD